MKASSLLFLLHSHIPYVYRSGVWPFGEEWLYEAAADTYIPFLEMLKRLSSGGSNPAFTINLSPVLLEQLANGEIREGLLKYLRDRIKYAGLDYAAFSGEGNRKLADMAENYRGHYEGLIRSLESMDCDLVGSFRRFRDAGLIEITASAATHSYLPLLLRDSSVYAQIRIGIELYEKHFGSRPLGFWLPECGYRPEYRIYDPHGASYIKPSLDEILWQEGIKYFFCDESAVNSPFFDTDRTPREVDYQACSQGDMFYPEPFRLASGCAVFIRNRKASMQVWSGDYGYPASGEYLEFHKKSEKSGLRYWGITDRQLPLGEKSEYDPEKAAAAIDSHAGHYADAVREILSGAGTENPVLPVYFDMELFGHWWAEGVAFLEAFASKLSGEGTVGMSLPSVMDINPPDLAPAVLNESSWGRGGAHYIWLNEETAWIWPYIYIAEEKVERILSLYPEAGEEEIKYLKQMAIENLLLQSSDWIFMVTTNQAKSYALERIMSHFKNLEALSNILENMNFNDESREILDRIRSFSGIMDIVDYRHFRSREP